MEKQINNIKRKNSKLGWINYIGIVAIGLISGVFNGLFGGGAGLLIVPALTIIVKLEQKLAQSTTIAIIMPLCVVSSIIYIHNGYFQLEGSWIVFGCVIGGIIGVWIMNKLANSFISMIFYILMIVAGVTTVLR